MIYVPLRVFDAVNKQYKLDEGIGGAYSFAAVMTMELVDLWMLRKHPREALFHIVERVTRDKVNFDGFVRRTTEATRDRKVRPENKQVVSSIRGCGPRGLRTRNRVCPGGGTHTRSSSTWGVPRAVV
jgi:hypothetical protein